MFQPQTLTPMQDLILLLMASEVEGLTSFLMLESSTLVYHLTVPLNLLIATMRKKRGISMK